MGVCEEVATCLGIDAGIVFWFDRECRRPVIAVWIEKWTNADLARSMKLKPEVDAIADRYVAKIYMTRLHPFEQERREQSRKRENNKWKRRHGKGDRQLWRANKWKLQRGLCMWCNEFVPKHHATLEHIVPLSAGGGTRPQNLGMACGPCNSNRYKMSRMVTFWKLFKFHLRLKFRLTFPTGKPKEAT